MPTFNRPKEKGGGPKPAALDLVHDDAWLAD
jgi:hypothetical protein